MVHAEYQYVVILVHADKLASEKAILCKIEGTLNGILYEFAAPALPSLDNFALATL